VSSVHLAAPMVSALHSHFSELSWKNFSLDKLKKIIHFIYFLLILKDEKRDDVSGQGPSSYPFGPSHAEPAI